MNHLSKGSPCKDCKDRSINPPCHDVCERYLEFAENCKTIREKRSKTRKQVNMEFDFIMARKKRAGKKMGRS